MRYSEFINRTLSNKNDINWNYYRTYINTADLFQGYRSKDFIRQYFQNGEKELPLFLRPLCSNKINKNFLFANEKCLNLSFKFDERYQMPDDRAIHTVSGFFLGLLIENCINGTSSLALESVNPFPFSYLWFLSYLYHDYGYSVTERDNCPVNFPKCAPKPDLNENCSKGATIKEYQALYKIKKMFGINLSPFSTFQNASLTNLNKYVKYHYLEHRLLINLTQRNNTISGKQKLCFTTGTKIQGPQYPSYVITRYLNYCINERTRVDHGIIGGYLFYDRMIKNYMLSYMSLCSEYNHNPNLEDFNYRSRHFCKEQLIIFSYIADCILVHNIWKQPDDKRDIYKQYELDALFTENYKTITFNENPLLYILVITDSLEPTKIYGHLSPELVMDAINIDYQPASHSLIFSSNSDIVDIRALHQKAQDLEEWTTVKCSCLIDGKFTLHI